VIRRRFRGHLEAALTRLRAVAGWDGSMFSLHELELLDFRRDSLTIGEQVLASVG